MIRLATRALNEHTNHAVVGCVTLNWLPVTGARPIP